MRFECRDHEGKMLVEFLAQRLRPVAEFAPVDTLGGGGSRAGLPPGEAGSSRPATPR